MMQTRQLGNSLLHLTTVGLGTWAIGGGNWKFGWGPQDDAESIRSIRHALDLGVNWIDTAPAYGLGHCEEVVGQALQGLSQRPLVATKCGRCWGADRQLFPRLKADSVRAEVDASLKRLGLETIDLYQIHWPQPDEDIEEAWGVVADMVRAGKVRYAGVSNFNVDQLKRLQAIHPITSLQPPYSLLARGIEAEVLPFCAAHNIGVVAYSPMQKGLLTGKITRAWIDGLPAEDHRRNDPNFTEPKLTANLELVAGLQSIAERLQTTAAQLAIAWVLRRPEVTAAIVGARKPSQIEETAPAGDLQIPAAELEAIDQLLMIHAAAA
jgi:aryl-alcohol dehydrogenase-like predicted oxidoreductase